MTDIRKCITFDKAAREYAEDRYRYCCDDLGEPIPEDVDLRLTSYESDYNSFIAGAQSRQSEIDELIEAVEEMYKACSNIEVINTHGNGKAAQLLEKCGKNDNNLPGLRRETLR